MGRWALNWRSRMSCACSKQRERKEMAMSTISISCSGRWTFGPKSRSVGDVMHGLPVPFVCG
eukprot:8998450-Pyramimonas_sp.AAC.1